MICKENTLTILVVWKLHDAFHTRSMPNPNPTQPNPTLNPNPIPNPQTLTLNPNPNHSVVIRHHSIVIRHHSIVIRHSNCMRMREVTNNLTTAPHISLTYIFTLKIGI